MTGTRSSHRHAGLPGFDLLASGLAVAALVALVVLVASPVPALAQASGTTSEGFGEEEEDLGKISYDPQGRRDPFRPLTGEAPAEEERSQYKGQLRGLLWDQAKLTAIVRTPNGNVAMFEGGPNKEGYPARVGDRFWDAMLFDIDYAEGSVTVRQELDDPRLLKPYRDHIIPINPNQPTGTARRR